MKGRQSGCKWTGVDEVTPPNWMSLIYCLSLRFVIQKQTSLSSLKNSWCETLENFIGELTQRDPLNLKTEPKKFIFYWVFGDLIGIAFWKACLNIFLFVIGIISTCQDVLKTFTEQNGSETDIFLLWLNFHHISSLYLLTILF